MEKTGARGLMTVMERTLRDFKFELPSSGIKSFELDTQTVDSPKESLKKTLSENIGLRHSAMLEDLTRFREEFLARTGYALNLDDKAKSAIIGKAVEEDKSLMTVCENVFKDFEHGLAIVSRNTGKSEFDITEQAITDTDKFLSDLVVKSFKEKEADGH